MNCLSGAVAWPDDEGEVGGEAGDLAGAVPELQGMPVRHPPCAPGRVLRQVNPIAGRCGVGQVHEVGTGEGAGSGEVVVEAKRGGTGMASNAQQVGEADEKGLWYLVNQGHGG